VLALLAGLSGCNGTLVNGAHIVPTVTYKPDANAVAETETAAPAETTTTAEAGGVGNLKGKVVYEGSFSPLPALFAKGAATKDPTVCGAEAIPNQSIIVNDGGLANVFVYLEKAPKGAKSAEAGGPIGFDQKTCIFLPHAMIVRTKQVINVMNDDAAAHNTHTYPNKNAQFNSVVQPNDRKGVPMTYSQPEKQPLSVGCDIHPWMQAFHLPLDHSFAALSGADGTFEIKDLPAGKHEFKVWHEVGKMLEKSLVVTIKPGDNEITIKVAASKLSK
jgi:hypothetical protein